MKLEIRWRDVTPSAQLLAYVKEGVAAWARPHPWATRLRVSLSAHGQAWARCRIEVGLRGGAVRVIEAASDDLYFAIDAAIERLTVAVDGHERAAERRAA
jgi:ribosome-associated translation inhibitor RaiA